MNDEIGHPSAGLKEKKCHNCGNEDHGLEQCALRPSEVTYDHDGICKRWTQDRPVRPTEFMEKVKKARKSLQLWCERDTLQLVEYIEDLENRFKEYLQYTEKLLHDF